MASYFDLIKKKDKLAPEYEQQTSITSDEGVAMRGVSDIQQPTITETVGASGADAYQGAEQKMEEASNLTHGMSANPTAYERIQAGQDPFAALLERNYNEDKASLERQRKAEVLGNLATVFGQSIASAAGARQFKPVQSNVAAYNNALDKLRQNYNNTLANYALTEARADRNAEIAAQQAELKFAKDVALAELKNKQQMGLLTAKQVFDDAQRIAKAKDAQELAKINNEAALQRTRTSAAASAARQKASDDAAMERKKYEVDNKGGSQSGKRSIRLKYDDGTEETVTYDKSMEGAISSLYERMRQLVTENPGKYGTSLDELKLRFEDGGDSASKIMSIVARKIGNFPELAPEFNEIIGRKQEDESWSLKDDEEEGWSLK